ncbi:OPT oligopeptide transporter protein-domain-containing protein [Mycena sp. CBHHK59/15]|nr:OPT oligopeptide transporter protein-domain-containing protein [Mycena sp. CBHHK59/15]
MYSSASLQTGSLWQLGQQVVLHPLRNILTNGIPAYLPANAKIYYDIDMNPLIALCFGWAVSIIGFSFAAFVRQILIYDPAFIFSVSLQQVKLYRSIHNSDSTYANRQMRGFWFVCIGMFVLQFFPEFIFPMTASLAPLCWIGRRNKAMNFAGSGLGGMGVLNFILNVSNITSKIVTQPFFAQVILFSAFVLTSRVDPHPIAYFGNQWGTPTFKVMSIGLEWLSIFLAAFVVLLAIVLKGHIYMPLFTLLIALAFGAVATLPMSMVYTISGYQVDIGYFNELVYGYMLQAPGSSRHPLGQLAYLIVAGSVWYDTCSIIEDQKIGHYMHVPPRTVMPRCAGFSPRVSTTQPIPLSLYLFAFTYAKHRLRAIKIDPNAEWTGQDLRAYNTAGIQYALRAALVGPRNLFTDARCGFDPSVPSDGRVKRRPSFATDGTHPSVKARAKGS